MAVVFAIAALLGIALVVAVAAIVTSTNRHKDGPQCR
jgi:hypothetical protein